MISKVPPGTCSDPKSEQQEEQRVDTRRCFLPFSEGRFRGAWT